MRKFILLLIFLIPNLSNAELTAYGTVLSSQLSNQLVNPQLVKTQQDAQPLEFLYQKTIQLTEAWTLVDSADRVPIAVIDLDFVIDHPAMKNIFDLKLAYDYSESNWKQIAYPESYHGLLVASAVAAQHKKSWIIPYNLGAAHMNTAGVTKAVYEAIHAGARIINLSLGESHVDPAQAPMYEAMADYALKKDVLILIAAGNYGCKLEKEPSYPALLANNYPNVMTIGASDHTDKPWKHSCYSKKYVSLFAPGENIRVLSPTGERLTSGTSEATPITTGVAALILQLRPDLTASQVKSILIRSVDKSPAFAGKSVSGGRLNAYKALQLAQAQKIRLPRLQVFPAYNARASAN